jgi:type I restriction enzyme S subunit
MPTGTVLFSSRAPIGYLAIASNPVSTSQGFKSFVLEEGISPDYIYYYLEHAKPLVLSLASGTTFLEISGENSEKIPVAVAPPSEQHRIVEAIESYFTRLDDAVATLERVKANLKRYRASLLKTAVEGRLVPAEAELAPKEGRDYEHASLLLERILNERRRCWEEAELARLRAKGEVPKDDRWKTKYEKPIAPNTSNLPELPKGWCWSSVCQLAADVGTGATPKRGEKRYYEQGNIPWITSGAVNQPVVSEADEHVTDAALAETNLTVYPPGTLLVAMYGEGKTRGKCTELRIPATTNQAIAAIVLGQGEDTLRRWLRLFFEYNYAATRRLSSGGVQPNLNLSLVRGLPIPLPPQAEQARICTEVEARLTVADSLVFLEEANGLRCFRLRQAILKWAFEGKLVDQDPTDEPASVLLDRIKAERQKTQAKGDANSGRGRKRKMA